MKAVIIAGGRPPSEKLLKNELEYCNFLIAADSGCNYLYKYNIIPDYIIGDFDSIDSEVFEFYKNNNCIIKRYPKDKDYTDTELAFILASDLNVNKITLLGVTGSRIDHLIGNVGILLKGLDNNINIIIKDDNNEIFMIDSPIIIEGEKGKVFSIQSYCNVVENLTIKGAKFNLNNYNLKLGDSLTLSNEFEKSKVEITFDKGVLLILYSYD